MNKLQSFKDLNIWQKVVDLASLVYKVTENFPKSELYGITNQMRRASISISSNIAEGFKRSHGKEKVQFYNIVYGSVAELESQIEISKRLGFLKEEEDYKLLMNLVIEVSKMIDALIKSTHKYSNLLLIFAILTLSSISYVLNPQSVSAATLYFNSPLGTEVGVGQTMPVEVLLDADGENLNAVELEIVYNKNFLEPVGFKDGGSVVQFWVERPNLEKGALALKGIMPNGFNWQKGLIGTLDFKTLTPGITEIRFGANPKTFLNDGLGTEARTGVRNMEFRILKSKGQIPDFEFQIPDKYPPEKFNPEVIQDQNVFDGQYTLIFATQDKQSGMDHYEVLEFRSWNLEFRKIFSFIPNSRFQIPDSYEIAESPYLLKDQTRESYIFVKAVDQKGNERVEKFYPISYKSWYQRPLTYIIVAVLLVLAAMAIKQLRRIRAML